MSAPGVLRGLEQGEHPNVDGVPTVPAVARIGAVAVGHSERAAKVPQRPPDTESSEHGKDVPHPGQRYAVRGLAVTAELAGMNAHPDGRHVAPHAEGSTDSVPIPRP